MTDALAEYAVKEAFLKKKAKALFERNKEER